MKFDVIAFDADDTLWHSENIYQDTQKAFIEMLAAYGVAPEPALAVLHRIEITNLPTFGYGIKGFTISMIETAVEATGGAVQAVDIQKVVELGRAMTSHEVRLLDYSAETLENLTRQHRLLLVTKGDLMDQERKLAESGLAQWFAFVEIVSDKTPEVYAALLRKHGLAAERLLMVGNSMRSDILPVLRLGGTAVLVPYALTWAHEAEVVFDETEKQSGTDLRSRFFEIENLSMLPALVEDLERLA